MTKKHKKKNKIEKLADRLQNQSQVSDEPNLPNPTPLPSNIILDEVIKPELLAKWPKLNLKIPPIFLHKPIDFEKYVGEILDMGIQFYQPHQGRNYTRITCASNNDHKLMENYFIKKQLPFHTFGRPSKRKMKVVIRGMPIETNLNKIKKVLNSVYIPVLRVLKMHTKVEKKDNTMLVLAVVPHNDRGKAILKVTQILGHNIVLEPPLTKPRQCHLCQKWGHSQRYCHGNMKCVKCAGNHLTQQCHKTSEREPPKCANCSDDHTANYKQCVFAPGSRQYQMMQDNKTIKSYFYKPKQLVTKENCHTLYKNVDYTKYFTSRSKPAKPYCKDPKK